MLVDIESLKNEAIQVPFHAPAERMMPQSRPDRRLDIANSSIPRSFSLSPHPPHESLRISPKEPFRSAMYRNQAEWQSEEIHGRVGASPQVHKYQVHPWIGMANHPRNHGKLRSQGSVGLYRECHPYTNILQSMLTPSRPSATPSTMN